VTENGLKALELQLRDAREAYEAAQKIEDVNERRRLSAIPLRDARYYSERLRTAQLVPDPVSTDVVAFGSTVTFSRSDGRVQKFRIVGEDEADPKAGTVSFASPVAKSLLGKAVGEVVGSGSQELEIIADRLKIRIAAALLDGGSHRLSDAGPHLMQEAPGRKRR
jgi:transcription elongation GreA/GreB family factor